IRDKLKIRTLRAKDDSHLRFTQPCGRLDKCIQHGLQIESRATDHLEHVGGGGLPLKGFAQLLGARLHLVEQPDILNCDHRLVGEGRDKIDLLLGEWVNHSSRQEYDTDWIFLSQKRNTKDGAKAPTFLAFENSKFPIG